MELSLLHASWTQGNALSVSEVLTDRKTELFARNFFFLSFWKVCEEKSQKCVNVEGIAGRDREKDIFSVILYFGAFLAIRQSEGKESEESEGERGEYDPDMIQAKFKPGSLWANTSYML